jgi:AcrR family transcriptional regulator
MVQRITAVRQTSAFLRMRKAERQTRKQHIIESATNLFGRKPFMEIGMREIASEAGVSPAAIYRYFDSREGLLVEAFIHDIIGIMQKFEVDLKAGTLPLEEFTDYVINYLIEHDATFHMMSYVMVSGRMQPELIDRFNRIQRNFLAEFDKVLQSAGLPEPVRLFSQAFFSSLAGVAMTYRNYPGRSKDEIKKHMLRLGRMISAMFKAGSAAAAETLRNQSPSG